MSKLWIKINRCPNEDRVRLSTESVDNFGEWMKQQDKINPEISYWLPLYIPF